MKTAFKRFKDNHDSSMQEMFAAVSDFYAQYWGDFFHFAIFDHEGQSWEDAFQRTHDAYIQDLRLDTAQKVIELACGRGGFSNILASRTQAEVLGIDISATILGRPRS